MDVEKIPLEEWQKKGGQPKADFNECLRLSRSLLEHNVHKPEELNSREVLAISYYYDRASDHGLIGKQINQNPCLRHYAIIYSLSKLCNRFYRRR